MALSPTGTVQWTRVLGGSGADLLHGLAVEPDGSIAAAGETNSSDGDFTIPTGHPAIHYDVTGSTYSTNGNFGAQHGPTYGQRALVTQIGSDGTLQWYTLPDGPDLEGGFDAVAVRPDDAPVWSHIYDSGSFDTFTEVDITDADTGDLVVVGCTAATQGDFQTQGGDQDALIVGFGAS